MTLKQITICLGLSHLLIHHAVAAPDPTLTYKNQRGSTMVLVWHSEYEDTGTLSGTFTTAVGNCKEDIGVAVPLVGYFNGNALSISINFPHCKQVVAMTGNISDDQRSIHTLWFDANQANDPRGSNWNSNIVGSDSYNQARSQ